MSDIDKMFEELDGSQETKLVDWKNPPKLSDLSGDLQSSTESHNSQVATIDSWLENFEAKTPKDKSSSQSNIEIPLIRKQAEWKYAALSEPFLSSDDLFDVSPVTFDDVAAANQNALVLNNQFATRIDKTALVDRVIRAAVTEGTVIVRTGWRIEMAKVVEPEYQVELTPIMDPQVAEQLAQYAQVATAEPDTFEKLPPEMKEAIRHFLETEQPVVGRLVSQRDVIVEKPSFNGPTVEVCDYRNVYLDPTCNGDLNKANFVIYSFDTSLSELKLDGRYKNLDKLEKPSPVNAAAQVDSVTKQTLHSSSFSFQDTPRKKLRAYEYWGNWDIDGDGTVKPIVATWIEGTDYFIRLENNPFPDKKPPFVVASYMPIKNSLYGEPDGALLADNQSIASAITRGVIDLWAKSANSQTGIAKGMLDPLNRTRYLKGDDYEFNPNIHPTQGIYQHKFPELPVTALNYLNMINGEAESISGTKAFSTGGGITGASLGATAQGVRSSMDAASKREMGILRRLSNLFVQVGRKIIAMNSAFLDETEVVRITNSEFVEVRRDDLAGNFDLSLSISTAETDDAKAQQLAFMLQTMGNTMGMDLAQIVLSEIANLRKMPDLAKRIAEYAPQPDPLQQQIQQAELQKLQAEIMLLQAQAQEAGSKGILNETKVGVEQARAESLQGDADSKVLDFNERSQGITHNREMDKIDQQGKNQLDVASRNNSVKAIAEGLKQSASLAMHQSKPKA